jgi:hypothetical protein
MLHTLPETALPARLGHPITTAVDHPGVAIKRPSPTDDGLWVSRAKPGLFERQHLQ